MEKGKLSVEKRKFPRVALKAEVRFRKLATAEAEAASADFVQAKTKDLSQGGIALEETVHLANGDLLKLEIDVPGRDKPIKAYSEVMWIKPPGGKQGDPLELAGIKFMGLRAEDEEYLAEMIAEAVKEGAGVDGNPSSDNPARLSEHEFIRKMGKRFTGE